MRYLIIVFAATLFLSCSPPETLIGEQQAIAIAIKAASTSYFHFTGTTEAPTNAKAELETLDGATAKLLGQGYGLSYNRTTNLPDKKVWTVTMDGSWPKNFPPLLPNESPREPWHHLAVLLDAKTGDVITLAVP